MGWKAHAMVPLWKSEEHQELVPSFSHVAPGNQTQVLELCGKNFQAPSCHPFIWAFKQMGGCAIVQPVAKFALQPK